VGLVIGLADVLRKECALWKRIAASH